MINRALRFISFEIRGFHAAVYILALSSFLSSLLALLRDRLLAHYFGAGEILDLYYAAFRIPDLLFVALGALVSVYILIPELAKRSKEEQHKYFDTIVAGFFVCAGGISLVLMYVAPLILKLLFPQLAANDLSTLVSLTRIMLLQPILLGFSNVLAAITQARHRYALYSISPLLYNGGIIVGVLALYPLIGITGLAWGVVLGALLHLGIQLPSIAADGFFRRLPRIRDARALLATATLSVPRALALSMGQIAFTGLTMLAGGLATGSIAVFMFAYNLQAVPLGIIGASYSVAAFPTLAAALSNGDRHVFLEHVALAARQVLFWSLPAAALIIVLRAHIVRAVLGSGAFDWIDTRLTAAALAAFSIALASQGLSLLLVRSYYAAGRTLVPFFVSLGSTIVTIVLGALFVNTLQIDSVLSLIQSVFRLTGVSGSEVLALPIAYAIASIGGTIALAWHFDRRFGGFVRQITTPLAQGIVAAVGGAAAAYVTLAIVGTVTFTSTLVSVLMRGFIAGSVGLVVSALVYAILGSREYAENVEAIRNRLWRRPAPEQQPIVSAEETAQ